MSVNAVIIDMADIQLFFYPVNNGLRLSVHTTHRGYNPQLVADTHFAVIPQIPLYFQIASRNIQCVCLWLINVFKVILQVGFHIINMHMFAACYINGRMPDEIAVFIYIFIFGNVTKCKFMTGGHRFFDADIRSVNVHYISCGKLTDDYSNIIRRMYNQMFIYFHNCLYFVLLRQSTYLYLE